MQGFKDFINESVDLSVEHEILSMYKDSGRFQIRKISEITGVSVAEIYRVLGRYGIKPHRRHDNQHGIVQQYYSSGISPQKISELTGYSKRQVYNIVAKNRLAD